MTPFDLESMKSVEHKDLNEEDSNKVKYLKFKDFKQLFIFEKITFNEAVVLVLCVRQNLENAISQNHVVVVDGHKKHAWLCQKTFDLLKINSAYILKKKVDELKENAIKKRDEGKELTPEEKHIVDMSETKLPHISDKRRFHVLPGSEQ